MRSPPWWCRAHGAGGIGCVRDARRIFLEPRPSGVDPRLARRPAGGYARVDEVQTCTSGRSPPGRPAVRARTGRAGTTATDSAATSSRCWPTTTHHPHHPAGRHTASDRVHAGRRATAALAEPPLRDTHGPVHREGHTPLTRHNAKPLMHTEVARIAAPTCSMLRAVPDPKLRSAWCQLTST